MAYRGSREISIGYNKDKTSSWCDGIIKRNGVVKQRENTVDDVPVSRCIHAETDCLKNAGGIDMLVVVRKDTSGKQANARPCNICLAAIKERGIRKVYYSTPEGMKRLQL